MGIGRIHGITDIMLKTDDNIIQFLSNNAEYFEPWSLMDSLIRWILWSLTFMLNVVLSAVESIFSYAFKLVDLSNAWGSSFEAFSGGNLSGIWSGFDGADTGGALNGIFSTVSWVMLGIFYVSFIMVAVAYIVGKKRPEILKNLLLSLATI